MPGMHGRNAAGEKAKDFKGTIKKLIRYMSAFKFHMLFVAVFAICGTIFNIAGPKILGKATTEIFNGLVSKVSGGSGIDFGKVGEILLLTLGLYLISALCTFIQGIIMTGVSQKTTYRLRKEISEKINRMPMNYFDTKPVGEILSRVTNDVDTLGQSLNQSATQLITSVTTIIGVLVMMLSICPVLVLVFAVTIPLATALTNESTGVLPWLTGIFSPIFEGRSPVFILVFTIIVMLILTNVGSNIAFGGAMIPVVSPFVIASGMNPVVAGAALIWMANMGLVLPGASAPASIFHGRSEIPDAGLRTKIVLFSAALLLIMSIVVFSLAYLVTA